MLADKSPPLSEIRLSDLLGTLAANLLLSRPPALVPLARADLPALRQAALGLHEASAGLSAAARRTIRETLRQRVAERSVGTEADALWPPAPSAVDRFVDHTLDRGGRSAVAGDAAAKKTTGCVSTRRLECYYCIGFRLRAVQGRCCRGR